MFFTEHPESDVLVPVRSPLRIERGLVVSILKPEERDVADRVLNGRSITDVIRRIRLTGR